MPDTPRSRRFTVARFREEDAEGVVALFSAVYGDSYPIAAFRDPALLAAQNRAGRITSAVARSDDGQVVAHSGLCRSSPPFPRLLEAGIMAVLPDWRETFVAMRLGVWVMESLVLETPAEAVFGEAVCNVTATQRLSFLTGYAPVALEADLMPEGSYAREGEPGSVSCLVVFRSWRDRRRALHVPAAYRDEIAFLLEGLGLERDLVSASSLLEPDPTAISVEDFGAAGVRRAALSLAGRDIDEVIDTLEAPGASAHVRVRQVCVSLAHPSCGAAVDALRARGWFLGGLLPRWFDDDALLMQKLEGPPGFDRVHLHGERAAAILDLVRRDHERARSAAGREEARPGASS